MVCEVWVAYEVWEVWVVWVVLEVWVVGVVRDWVVRANCLKFFYPYLTMPQAAGKKLNSLFHRSNDRWFDKCLGQRGIVPTSVASTATESSIPAAAHLTAVAAIVERVASTIVSPVPPSRGGVGPLTQIQRRSRRGCLTSGVATVTN